MSARDTISPITHEERQQRLSALQNSLPAFELDAVMITPGASMRYFFGLTRRETERLVCAVVSAQRVVFVCPKFEDTALLAALSSTCASTYDYAWWEEHEDPRHVVATVLSDSHCQSGGLIQVAHTARRLHWAMSHRRRCAQRAPFYRACARKSPQPSSL